MTQKQAVEKSIKMWLWLAKHPEKNKRDYMNLFHPRTEIIHDCFLCEVFWVRNAKDEKECSECPLNSIELLCSNEEDETTAPWDLWLIAKENCEIKEIKKQAMRIVTACRRWKAKRGKPAKRGREK